MREEMISMMKYYNPATRKRPDFTQMMANYGKGTVVCPCMVILMYTREVFEHWQQGHFDVYEEYKDKKEE